MVTSEETPARGTPIWVKMLLGVSLAVNLLIVGFVVGAAIRFDHSGPPAAHSGFAFLSALDRAERRAVFRELRRGFGRDSRSEARTRTAAVLDLIRADTYDADAVAEAMRRMVVAQDGRQAAVISAVTTQIAQMTPEQRRAYAARVETQMRKGRDRRKP